MLDNLQRELQAQAAFLRDREPVYERMLELFSDAIGGAFGVRLARLWAHRTFNSPYERPLLLLAAIRYDALLEGVDHPLHRALAEETVHADAVTADGVADALSPARTRVERALRDRAVQTNETTRAVAWLWPAHLLSSIGERRSIALVDLGASAGLNLVADDLPPLWVDENDKPIPIDPRPPVAVRLGLDAAPLNVHRPDDAMWLRACVWPSDGPRLARLEQAIEAFRRTSGRADAPVLEARPLTDAASRLALLPGDMFVLCVQTIVRDYLTTAESARYQAGIREFLLRRSPRSAMVVELEVDLEKPGVAARSATLVLRFASSGRVHELLMARTHPHPRQLFVEADAVRAFTDAFGAAS